MTRFGPAVDAALEACVVPGFSRIGLAVRSALLPEFTADDHPSADGRTVVITGATSGIGHAAAVALARRGAAVHFLARDHGRAERARDAIAAASGSTSVSYGLADLENLDAVRAFARGFRATHDRLDALIHNAGAIHPEFRTDGAGTELTILGQVVAPFLLTTLLMPALLAAAPSRVITVSSGGMYTQRLDPTTLQLPASRYRGVTAYARAKRAQVALSREWARRLAGTGVAFHAMHPGWVGHPRGRHRAPGLPPRHAADPALTRAGSRHDRLAGHRASHAAGQRPVLARPARPARIPAAVDARDRPQHRTQVLGPPGRGDRHRLARSWRRQGRTALPLGHLSAGAGMIEQQPHEAVDRPDGFELRRTWVAGIEVAARLMRRPTVRSVRWRGFIDGASRSRRQIAMPDPVTQQKDGPEKIVMTAPAGATATGSASAEG